MADEASQFKKELDLLKLELSTMKNSIELLQSDPVVNNLPGGSLVTPNLSTREHSPYWGPFRCEISEDGYSVNIGAGQAFFGSEGLTNDYTGGTIAVSPFISQYVWVGLKCEIASNPETDNTWVTPVTSILPLQVAGQYDVWLAKVFVGGDGKATWLEQRWQGSDIYVPVWLYCGDTDGDSFVCVDEVAQTDAHTCKRVAQLGSPACNPGNHNHVLSVKIYDATVLGVSNDVTDCWCEGT